MFFRGDKMELFRARKEIVEIGKRMYENGLVVAFDGNISIRVEKNRVLATPQGVCKGELNIDDIVLMDLNGNVFNGAKKPSSEIKMHLVAYNIREDIKAVVHAHPQYSTAFAVSEFDLSKCVLPEVIATLGAIPKAPYATPSTTEVPDSIKELVPKCDAMLLQNHGVLTFGEDLKQAYYRLETVEHFARIYYYAMNIGQINYLSKEDVEKIMEVRKKLGYPGRNVPCIVCDVTQCK
ncbi:MAG: class II aldolase/adducin family protein [Candidatus Hydrogenedentota bacterium]